MDELSEYPFEWTKNEHPLYDVIEAENRGEDYKYIRFRQKNRCKLSNKDNVYKTSIPNGGDMFVGIILNKEDYKNVESITIRTGEFVSGHTTIIEKLSNKEITLLSHDSDNEKHIMINRLPLINLAFSPILVEIETKEKKDIKRIDVIYEYCTRDLRRRFADMLSEELVYRNTKGDKFGIKFGLIGIYPN